MGKYIKQIEAFWVNYFFTRPSNLQALRIVVSMLFSLLVSFLLGYPKEGLSIGMGIMATALTENDIHIKSALRSSVVILVLFAVFSSLTGLLMPYPLAFAFFLVIATFSLTMVSGYKAKYSNLAFGSTLITLYTMMIGTSGAEWYEIPILFSIGVLIYMPFSIFIFYIKPFQNVQNELNRGYGLLGEYLKTKAKFFPSTAEEQEEIRNELALINIELFSQTEKIKVLLQKLDKIITKSQRIHFQKYVNEWNKLQELHERAVSSHESYDLISQNREDTMLVEGFGKMLKEIGEAIDSYSVSILKNMPYKPSSSLVWTKNALKLLVEKDKNGQKEYIKFLLKNITSIEESLVRQVSEDKEMLKMADEKISFKSLFTVNHPRFRHAVRLSLCFLVGYALMVSFKIELGAWILLTSFIVCQQTYDATRQRFFKRIIGTLLGIILGIILAILVTTDLGQLTILLCSVFMFVKNIQTNFTLGVIFVTVFVLEVFNILNGSGMAVMFPRIVDTLIGAVLAYLSIHFIWPEWQYKNLKPLLIRAIDKNIRYFEGVMNARISDIDYMHNQRSAHRADNSLTQVWKGMQLEPKSKRGLLTFARDFTYLNHTLISYISAMGVHRKSLEFSQENYNQKQKIINVLNDVKNLIQEDKTISEQEIKDIYETLENTKESSGNELFLKNILNVSTEMKEAAREIQFSK